jgi:serine/threonine-protein kinase RsbT
MSGPRELRVIIRHESDVAVARLRSRELSLAQGLPECAVEALATAVSEVARNIVVHAGRGEILLTTCEEHGRRGVIARASDDGPGIADREAAMRDGFSTARSLGLGLPSARRLVDEFDLVTSPGGGTTILLKKLGPAPPPRRS